jgi:hypothetical protein
LVFLVETSTQGIQEMAQQSGFPYVAQLIGFHDAEARRWQQARALTRRRGNLFALNRGPFRRLWGFGCFGRRASRRLSRPGYGWDVRGGVQARATSSRRRSRWRNARSERLRRPESFVSRRGSAARANVAARFGKGMIGVRLVQELSKPVLRRGREWAGSRVSMILILPPQQGHGGGSTGG